MSLPDRDAMFCGHCAGRVSLGPDKTSYCCRDAELVVLRAAVKEVIEVLGAEIAAPSIGYDQVATLQYAKLRLEHTRPAAPAAPTNGRRTARP